MDGGANEGLARNQVSDFNTRAPGLSTYDPKQWADFFEQMAQSQIKTERELFGKKNPEIYEALLRGTWLYGRSMPHSSPPTCMASFHSRQGGVAFFDWSGKEPGTFLAFFDSSIPRVRGVTRVQVRLEQSGKSQTVEAFHSNYPLLKHAGMLMLRVPSTTALLNSIQDEQDYKVFMREIDVLSRPGIGDLILPKRGRPDVEHEILSNRWHSGHNARDELRECIKQRDRR
jgi:hypothetical protein